MATDQGVQDEDFKTVTCFWSLWIPLIFSWKHMMELLPFSKIAMHIADLWVCNCLERFILCTSFRLRMIARFWKSMVRRTISYSRCVHYLLIHCGALVLIIWLMLWTCWFCTILWLHNLMLLDLNRVYWLIERQWCLNSTAQTKYRKKDDDAYFTCT